MAYPLVGLNAGCFSPFDGCVGNQRVWIAKWRDNVYQALAKLVLFAQILVGGGDWYPLAACEAVPSSLPEADSKTAGQPARAPDTLLSVCISLRGSLQAYFSIAIKPVGTSRATLKRAFDDQNSVSYFVLCIAYWAL